MIYTLGAGCYNNMYCKKYFPEYKYNTVFAGCVPYTYIDINPIECFFFNDFENNYFNKNNWMTIKNFPIVNGMKVNGFYNVKINFIKSHYENIDSFINSKLHNDYNNYLKNKNNFLHIIDLNFYYIKYPIDKIYSTITENLNSKNYICYVTDNYKGKIPKDLNTIYVSGEKLQNLEYVVDKKIHYPSQNFYILYRNLILDMIKEIKK